ncbi:MAG: CRISPR-associated protein Cas4 [Halanaerobiales bacterium]|nr:CRISPR-associated protein Cas4 [Halanaerobiales bacterium]
METNRVSITPSEVIEYMYCPRFIYFMLYLQIPQHEEQSYKVQVGRDIHKEKEEINKNYIRTKLDVKEKLISQYLSSENYQIHGIVDEILFIEDGTASPLDYKFAEYNGKIYETYKSQIVMYGLLIEENFKVPVKKGYIVYTRSKNKLMEIEITKKDRQKVLSTVDEIIRILQKGYYPEGTKYKSRCLDCCYRNICVK